MWAALTVLSADAAPSSDPTIAVVIALIGMFGGIGVALVSVRRDSEPAPPPATGVDEGDVRMREDIAALKGSAANHEQRIGQLERERGSRRERGDRADRQRDEH